LDCPVDVADTDVAVLSEATGISVVFKLREADDSAALDALRLRVRGLAERYRSERMATEGAKASGDVGSETAADAQTETALPSVPPSDPETGGPEGASSASSSDLMQSDDKFGRIAITVQDTEGGAKIIIGSEDIATLDVLRARLAQDAQIMTQTGSCPW
jgi:hypothetical protein